MEPPTSSAPAVPGRTALAPELRPAYWFVTFNALSYQIVLGSPMVLYAKHLEASATVLGILTGMTPLLVIFQIPAARHIGRVGYKRFVFAGWGTRVMFIFLIGLAPLTGRFLDVPSQIALMLFLLFGFNLSRGISSAAWLPWITALVPAEVRGHYLARDSACVNVGSCTTLLLAGLVLGSTPGAWQFSTIFLFSAAMGVVSLSFLKRIPEAARPALESQSRAPVPWQAIAAHPPFRKLLWMNVAWAFAYGGLATFTVAFLKASAGMAEGSILGLTATSYLGGLGGLLLFGARLDRHGSKPVLAMTLLAWVVVLVGWTLLAGGLIPAPLPFVVGLQLAMGLGYALFTMANTRLAMAVVPVMGRDHFFALFSVVGSLALGIAPVFWGVLIDAFGPRELWWLGLSVNRFSLFFALVTVACGVTVVLARRLDEPRATNIEELLRDLLAQMPLRSWMRFWPRG